MTRARSGFLLPGFVLTALACIGVAALIMSATGVLPDELPVLRSVGSGPRRNATVPAPSPTPSPSLTSRSPSATPSPSRSRSSSSPSATRSPSARPVVTVTPTATRPTTPPPPACRAGAVTLAAVADAYLDQSAPTRSFGATETLQVTSRDRSRNRRTVLRFPAPAVPKGCAVTGGTLTMTAREASGRRLLVAPATKAWSESTVTWANGPWPTGYATGATVSSASVRWDLPVSTVRAAYGFVVYDAAEDARGAGAQTNLVSRTGRGAPTLVVRWS